jgi:penicillin-binding protein 1B
MGLLVAGALVMMSFAGFSVAVLSNYNDAVQMIENGGEDQLVSDPAITIFPAPYTIHVGQRLNLDTESDRLKRTGYRQTDRGGRGTFVAAADHVTINPMWPEFTKVDIYLGEGAVTRIVEINGRSLDSVDLDREPLETFEYRKGNPVPVRYLPRPWAAFEGTPLADAVVLREDRDFWIQPDLPSYPLLRAIYNLGGAGGASGLVSQLSRNSVLHDRSRNTARKWRELGVATALLARLSREDLAALYFNKVRLAAIGGREIIGYPAAARALFGVREVSDLSLSQAATLAVMTSLPHEYLQAMLNAPEDHIEPASSPSSWRKLIPAFVVKKHEKVSRDQRLARLLRFRNELLENMHRFLPGRYSMEAISAAKLERLELHPGSPLNPEQSQIAGHFLDYLFTAPLPISSGRIHTTIDMELQQLATDSIRQHLDELIVRLHPKHADKLQASLIALRPDTGELVALAGARDPVRGSLDRATQVRRSAGSALKIIIFTWAVDYARGHDINMMTLVDGDHDPVEGNWRPDRHCGGQATLYFHIAQSTNCPPVVLGSWIGLSRLQQLFRDQLNANPVKHAGMVIGGAAGSEVRMIDLASLYAAVADGGLLRKPVTIRYIGNGQSVLSKPESTTKRVFSEKAAFLGLQMMTAPLQPYGTAAAAWGQMQLAPGTLYAKTGTGQVSDATYVSILGNRQLLFFAWVGMDDNEPLAMSEGFQGSSAAMPIVTTLIRQLNVIRPSVFESRPMAIPAPLVPIQVSPQKGCLVDAGGVTAYFTQDHLPDPCPMVKSHANHSAKRRPSKRVTTDRTVDTRQVKRVKRGNDNNERNVNLVK